MQARLLNGGVAVAVLLRGSGADRAQHDVVDLAAPSVAASKVIDEIEVTASACCSDNPSCRCCGGCPRLACPRLSN